VAPPINETIADSLAPYLLKKSIYSMRNITQSISHYKTVTYSDMQAAVLIVCRLIKL